MSLKARSYLLATSLFAGFGITAPAHAQTAAPTTPKASTSEEVVVTGTRIRSPGLVSSSPIASIGTAEIGRQIARDPEVVLRALGPVFPGNNEGSNNGTNGGATVALRGLGTNRTLVLVDGKRAIPFTLGGVVDLQTVPTALIDRIDVVTGGASSVYGADAVAGVVNFIMKRNFEGLELNARTSQTNYGDGDDSKLDLTMGASTEDKRGNVVVNIGWAERLAIRQDQRPFGLVQFSSVTGLPQGSATAVPPVIAPIGFSAAQAAAWRTAIGVTSGTANDGVPKGPNGSIIPYVEARDGFNFNPDNFYRTGFERYSGNARAFYEINKHAEVYGTLDFNRYTTAAQLASSGSFTTPNPIPLGNPFIPTAVRNQFCAALGITSGCVAGSAALPAVNMQVARRFTEFGPRINTFDITSFNLAGGVRGEIVEGWNYDVAYQIGESRSVETRNQWGSQSRLRSALNTLNGTTCLATPPTVNTTTLAPAFTGGVAPTGAVADCVPINIFGNTGSISPEAVRWVNLNATRGVNFMQEVGSGNITGDLGQTWKSPFAENPIGVAFGVEYRKVTAAQTADDPTQRQLAPGQPEVLGSGAPAVPYRGVFDLLEYNTEMSVPLIEGVPFIKELGLELGFRNTQFNTGGRSDQFPSYKGGFSWDISDSFRLRGMYQRAVRAPNAAELFQPLVTGLTSLASDPCSTTGTNAADFNTPGTISNICRLQGVPAGAVGGVQNPSANQAAFSQGGNPNLGPERADTITYGFVFRPGSEFLGGALDSLVVTADFYDIQVKGAIVGSSAADVINGCFSATLNPSRAFNVFCSKIVRGPTGAIQNALGIISDVNNLGLIKTRGIDLAVNYGFDLKQLGLNDKWGSVALDFRGTWTDKYGVQNLPTLPFLQCMGSNYGIYGGSCGVFTPKVKFEQSGNWAVGDFNLGYRWRHVGEGKVLPTLSAGLLPSVRQIEAYNYLDLNGAWNATKKLSFNVAVRNLTDKDPPALGGGFSGVTTSGNTLPSLYDAVGREVIVGVRARF
jgi:outer membrane receptor protein involved in Fe transport